MQILKLAVCLFTALGAFPARAQLSCIDVFSGERPGLRRLESMDTEFMRQARHYRLQVVQAKTAFRFDERSPDQVRAAGGFFGNTAKTHGDLWDHADPGGHGGSSEFVSMTLRPDHLDLAYRLDLGNDALRDNYDSPMPKRIPIAYEYKIDRAEGVLAEELVGEKDEDEMISPYVLIHKVIAYRRIYSAQSDDGYNGPLAGPWKPMK